MNRLKYKLKQLINIKKIEFSILFNKKCTYNTSLTYKLNKSDNVEYIRRYFVKRKYHVLVMLISDKPRTMTIRW